MHEECPQGGGNPVFDGWDAHHCSPIIAGYAPPAPRPDWLPTIGPGQGNVDPLCWSLSVAQWIFFVRTCVATDTWKKLVEVKGEYRISMYDVCEHFVKPWTAGTGCSIALLMNVAEQLPAEGMFSHAWAGSVVETYNCLQNMVNHCGVPSTARFFFCAFSLYQPADGAPGGLTIDEQIAREPFAKIISSRPTHGMFVLHTTITEVYDRLWVAHEADEGIGAEIQMRGLFDIYQWTVEKFEAAAAVKTSDGQVGVAKDRAYIEGLIMQRGGYERLDGVIAEFRMRMLEELKVFLAQTATQSGVGNSYESNWDSTKYDWRSHGGDDTYNGGDATTAWKFQAAWDVAMDGIRKSFGLPAFENPKEEKHETWDGGCYNRKCTLWFEPHPLGSKSFPFGPPMEMREERSF